MSTHLFGEDASRFFLEMLQTFRRRLLLSIAMFRSVLAAGLMALLPVAGASRAAASDLGGTVDRVLTTASIGAAGMAAGKPRGEIAIGVYDPHDAVASSDALQIEHVFIYWQALDKAMLKRKIAIAEGQGRALMISVEPYTHASDWRAGGERLFADIGRGRFDREIRDICRRAGEVAAPVYMRWGHEMEDPDGRYPWARRDMAGYKKAFRYFVESCRELAPDVRFVWSPKGHRNLAGYYPGDDVVDAIGIPVWGLQKMDLDYWGRERSFGETLGEKYQRVARFGKPVMVAELGVSGSADYKRAWYAEILDRKTYRDRFPLLTAVVFFNDKEPYKWPLGYGSPDWRLDKASLAALVSDKAGLTGRPTQ